MVWLLWFGTALSYYGMVLASAEILQLKNEERTGTCLIDLHFLDSSIYSKWTTESDINSGTDKEGIW